MKSGIVGDDGIELGFHPGYATDHVGGYRCGAGSVAAEGLIDAKLKSERRRKAPFSFYSWAILTEAHPVRRLDERKRMLLIYGPLYGCLLGGRAQGSAGQDVRLRTYRPWRACLSDP